MLTELQQMGSGALAEVDGVHLGGVHLGGVQEEAELRQGPGVTHLPWLMLTLLILLARMAVFVSVSITWSLCRTTSPWEENPRFRIMALVSLHQNYPAVRDRGQGQHQRG